MAVQKKMDIKLWFMHIGGYDLVHDLVQIYTIF